MWTNFRTPLFQSAPQQRATDLLTSSYVPTSDALMESYEERKTSLQISFQPAKAFQLAEVVGSLFGKHRSAKLAAVELSGVSSITNCWSGLANKIIDECAFSGPKIRAMSRQ